MAVAVLEAVLKGNALSGLAEGEAGVEALVTLATPEDPGGEADAALPEHQQHLTAYQ